MVAVFGLGNPGLRYYDTRHNAGFMVLDKIADKYNVPFKHCEGDCCFSKVRIAQQDVVLVKPLTYMNLSGKCVAEIVQKYTLDLDDCLVIYDDFHLPFGSIRFRSKGSAAGHNGLQSIIETVETDHIPRLKFGIGGAVEDTVGYVLSPFNNEEKNNLKSLLSFAREGVEAWVAEGIDKAMNRYNRNMLITKDSE